MKKITTMALFAALLSGVPVNYALADDITVSTEQALKDAIKNGNVITVDGEIVISEKITINGGKTVTIKGGTINGDGKCQIFDISQNSKVTFDGVTLKNALNAQTDGGATKGGAIKANGGTLTVKNCLFEDNRVTLTTRNNWSGGGAIHMESTVGDISNSTFIDNEGYHGGAITFQNATGTVTGCTFSGNKAVAVNEDNGDTRGGGAMFMRWDSDKAKQLTVTGCTFTGNTAAREGGAIYFMTGGGSATTDTDNNWFTLRNCTFSDNRTTSTAYPSKGGAIFLSTERAVTVNILSSTFYGNESRNNGGAILIAGENAKRMVDGVDIINFSRINIVNCTITGNSITDGGGGNGGGIYTDRQTKNNIDVTDCAEINIVNTIIAGNKGNNGNSDFRIQSDGDRCKAIKTLRNCLIRELNDRANLAEGKAGEHIDVTGTIYNNEVGKEQGNHDAERNIVYADGCYAAINGAAVMRFTGAKALAAEYGLTEDMFGNALTDEIIGAAQKVAVPVVAKMGMATVCSPVALDFGSAGLTAYGAKQNGNVVNLTAADGAVKAGEGVIVEPTEEIMENTTFLVTAVDGGSEIEGNELVGVQAQTTLGENAYVLSVEGDDNVKGFYRAAGKKIAAYKAYLNITGMSEAKMFSIVYGGGDVTAISNVNAADAEGDGVWYTLSGCRVARPTVSGIYIRNGKKIIIK